MMTYSQAIEFLYGLRLFGMKLGLENACAWPPRWALPIAACASSTSPAPTGKARPAPCWRASIARPVCASALFTSPHLVSFAERIQVDRRLISRDEVARLTEEIRAAVATWARTRIPTFFEVVTVMALQVLRRASNAIWSSGKRAWAGAWMPPTSSRRWPPSSPTSSWTTRNGSAKPCPKSPAKKPASSNPAFPSSRPPPTRPRWQVIAQTARHRQAPLTVVADPANPRL